MTMKDRLEKTYSLPPRPPLCRFGQGDESRDYDPAPESPCDWRGLLRAVAAMWLVILVISAAAYGVAELMIRGLR
jgi:hypothetical protein